MWRFIPLVGIVAGCTFALAAQPGAGVPKLLCVSNRTGNAEIFLTDPDGENAVNLTRDSGEDLFPAWSPDGKRIAFTSNRDGNPGIYVMNADGTNVKRLSADDGSDRAPAWSPDGKKIAFCRHVNGDPEVFVMDADGSNATNLTNNGAFDGDPAWSPDGKHIAFASNRADDGFQLYFMEANGSNVQRLSEARNPFGFVYPAWSPDGKRIAYTDVGKNALELFVRDYAQGKNDQLTKLTGLNTAVSWSPDGKRVAFLHLELADMATKVSSLHVMDADGKNSREVFKREVPIDGGRPAWKPK